MKTNLQNMLDQLEGEEYQGTDPVKDGLKTYVMKQ
jgi:hypothetical protein